MIQIKRYLRLRIAATHKHSATFDKFTGRAKRVLQLAQEEARRLNHNRIGTEHILLGLIGEREGIAGRVLAGMGVQLDRARFAVLFIVGMGDRPSTGDIGITPMAKRVMQLAVEEARRLNHNYIGTEHLLLGLLKEGKGVGVGVLESMGVTLERARAAVEQELRRIDRR